MPDDPGNNIERSAVGNINSHPQFAFHLRRFMAGNIGATGANVGGYAVDGTTGSLYMYGPFDLGSGLTSTFDSENHFEVTLSWLGSVM